MLITGGIVLILVSERLAIRKNLLKPVICPKCRRSKIGYTRDKLVTNKSLDDDVLEYPHKSIVVKCKVCGASVGLIFE